jgi:hypothetical protein
VPDFFHRQQTFQQSEQSDKFCPYGDAARRLASGAGQEQEPVAVWSIRSEATNFVEKRNAARPSRVPSGSHQEQLAFNVDKKSLAVCREATKRTKRPSGNRTAFSFKGE